MYPSLSHTLAQCLELIEYANVHILIIFNLLFNYLMMLQNLLAQLAKSKEQVMDLQN